MAIIFKNVAYWSFFILRKNGQEIEGEEKIPSLPKAIKAAREEIEEFEDCGIIFAIDQAGLLFFPQGSGFFTGEDFLSPS